MNWIGVGRDPRAQIRQETITAVQGKAMRALTRARAEDRNSAGELIYETQQKEN